MKIQSLIICLAITAYTQPLIAMQDPLLQAIRDKDLENLKAALEDQNPNYYNDSLNTTPLALACQEGHLPVVEALLEAGAYVDFQLTNKSEWPTHPTALTTTALTGNFDMCKLLLDRGAKANPHNPDNFTPLHAAARNGNAAIVQLLIEHGARVNAQTKQYRTTPLHEVIPQIADTETPKEKGNYKACRLLLEAGANPNLQTRYVSRGYQPQILADQTPLMMAAQRGKALYVYLLILFNADKSMLDKNGRTASELATLKDKNALAFLCEPR